MIVDRNIGGSVTAPRIRVTEIDAFERDVRLRLPFRFGAATLEKAPQAFLRVRVEDEEGRTALGAAAEMMVPKWFDKNPAFTPAQNVDQLRTSIRTAAAAALEQSAPTTLFAAARLNEMETVRRLPGNPLAAGFGPSLIARAALDAYCRLAGISFFEAVRGNLVGIGGPMLPGDIDADAASAMLTGLRPAGAISARHTIGLVDPISDSDIVHPVGDGLPESLEAVITRYGNRWFKIKLSGAIDADIDRLTRIAAVLDRLPDYRVTVDGNEQFGSAEQLAALLAQIEATPRLARLRAAIAFVEQPFSRAITMETPLGDLAAQLPFLIDESDDDDGAFAGARRLGYTGVSSKTCKGIYRSLMKAIRIRTGTVPGLFLSGEDLTCQAGLAVQQDLALVSLLGLSHVERNGHHYVAGMQGAPQAEKARFAAAHHDLYEQGADGPLLSIRDGRIDIGSLGAVGYASGALPDFEAMMPLS
ncbi:mandelate racemase (plasmid) [Rhizobium leguminosarum bv. trifolii WSM1689]|uniref:mandelate racemase n=1 Tax=Rhizobium leguminosarum TaxID=384 RepID=UPI0003E09CD4|nr:mandelate racemase [Rhizobium leguminosarum]AHF88347.1 mandelate racemase [Rhizobium leguminosarum bv. trifolii WSM1689]MBY5611530.1 mandelate racemase [Rhizobium leguminosarum]MBY5669645.1 mandelate racemase [Rhizobium leguminosarum]MBY5740466.1 mandelate racemase [Rhizobium leguminosarum]